MSKKVVDALKVLGQFLNTNKSDIFLVLGLIGVGIYLMITFSLEICLFSASKVTPVLATNIVLSFAE